MAVSDKMRKKLQQRQKELRSKGAGNGIIFMKEGTIRVRFLSPGPDEEFIREVNQVYLGPKIKGVISPTSIGKPCAIHERYLKLKKSKKDSDKELAGKLVEKPRYLGCVVMYKDLKGKEVDTQNSGKLIQITKGLYEAIIDHYLDEDWGDMTDPIRGYDVKLVRKGSGQLDTEYSIIPCPPTKAPKGWNKPIDLDKKIHEVIPTYEETQSKLDEFFSGPIDEEADDLGNSVPKKKKKKAGISSKVKKIRK